MRSTRSWFLHRALNRALTSASTQVLIRYVGDVNALNKELALIKLLGSDHVAPLFELHRSLSLSLSLSLFSLSLSLTYADVC